MKTIIHISVYVWVFVWLPSSIRAQDSWTLKQCITYAHENNIQIRQAEIDSKIAESRLRQSKLELFPDLYASGSARFSVGNTVIPVTNQLVRSEVLNSGYSLSSNMDLFRGFQNINAIRKNTLDFMASRYDVDKIKNDISLNVTNAYLLILFNLEIEEIAQEQVKISRQQAERMNKLVDAGGAAKGTALDLEAQLANDERQLIEARNQITLSYLNLYQLLQMDAESEFQIVRPILDNISLESEEVTSSQIYQKSLTVMPEVKSAELQLESSNKNLSISRASRSPYLSLGAAIGSGYTDNVVRPFEEQVRNNLYRNIGISLNIPIFTKYSIQHSVNQARLMQQRSEYNLTLIKNDLRQNIERAHADAKASKRSYEANQAAVDATREAFRYAEQRFEAGVINAVDFNISKNSLIQTESQLMRSKYDYLFKTKILDFFQGRAIEL